jgi:hypothetical protein
MMIAITTPPMTRPARSLGERESTIPRIANISMNVPIPSLKIAWVQVVASSLNEVIPIPRSIALCANTAQMANAPMTAPATWAAT